MKLSLHNPSGRIWFQEKVREESEAHFAILLTYIGCSARLSRHSEPALLCPPAQRLLSRGCEGVRLRPALTRTKMLNSLIMMVFSQKCCCHIKARIRFSLSSSHQAASFQVGNSRHIICAHIHTITKQKFWRARTRHAAFTRHF